MFNIFQGSAVPFIRLPWSDHISSVMHKIQDVTRTMSCMEANGREECGKGEWEWKEPNRRKDGMAHDNLCLYVYYTYI